MGSIGARSPADVEENPGMVVFETAFRIASLNAPAATVAERVASARSILAVMPRTNRTERRLLAQAVAAFNTAVAAEEAIVARDTADAANRAALAARVVRLEAELAARASPETQPQVGPPLVAQAGVGLQPPAVFMEPVAVPQQVPAVDTQAVDVTTVEGRVAEQVNCYSCLQPATGFASTMPNGEVVYNIKWMGRCRHWQCNPCHERAAAGGLQMRFGLERCGICRVPTGYHAATTRMERLGYYNNHTVDPYAAVPDAREPAALAADDLPPLVNSDDESSDDDGAPFFTAQVVRELGRTDTGLLITPPVPGLSRVIAQSEAALVAATGAVNLGDYIAAASQTALVHPLATTDGLGRFTNMSRRFGEAGNAALEVSRFRIRSDYGPPASSSTLIIPRFAGAPAFTVTARVTGLRSAAPHGYMHGAYGSMIDTLRPGHFVLAAQRRMMYKLAVELLANVRCVPIEFGGRPDIVENMPTSGATTASSGNQWCYACPLIMPEDWDREPALSNHHTSGVACRCRYPEEGPFVGCAVCGAGNLRLATGLLPFYVLMHTAYYFTPDMLNRMCQKSVGILIFAHEFAAFSGEMAFHRGGVETQVEATWTREGEDVTMNVNGGSHTYKHNAQGWMFKRSYYESADGCMCWRKVCHVGDLSPHADPSIKHPGGLNAMCFTRCERMQEAPAAPQGDVDTGSLGQLDGKTYRNMNGVDYAFEKMGGDVQIVMTGGSTQGGRMVVTMPWSVFDKVACIMPANDPTMGLRSTRMRAALHLSSVSVSAAILAIEAYIYPELQDFSEQRLANYPEMRDIAARLAGKAPERVGAVVATGVGIVAGAASGSIVLGAATGGATYAAANEFGILRTVGVVTYLKRKGWSKDRAMLVLGVVCFVAEFFIRRALRRRRGRVVAAVVALTAPVVASVNIGLTLDNFVVRARAYVAAISDIVDNRTPAGVRVVAEEESVSQKFERAVASCARMVHYTATVRARLARAGVAAVASWNAGALMAGSAAVVLQPPSVRSCNIHDIRRRFHFMVLRTVLHFWVPERAQLITSAFTMLCPVEGFGKAYRGLASGMNDITFEELLKEKIDWALTFMAQLILGRNRRVPDGIGHILFAVAEFGLKMRIAGATRNNMLLSAMPLCMHIAIRNYPRAKREWLHTVWNLVFLPVAMGGRMRMGQSELGKNIFDTGAGVYPVLKVGNYLVGQGYEMACDWLAKPMREDGKLRMPDEKREYAEKKKPLMVMAPLPCDPEFPYMAAVAVTLDNELRMVRNRILMEVPLIDDTYFDDVFEPAYWEMMGDLFQGEQVDEMSVSRWLKTFKPSRRQMLLDGYNEWYADAWANKTYVLNGKKFTRTRRAAFLKAEQTAENKDGRGIQTVQTVVSVPGGPWFASLAKLISEVGDGSRTYKGVHIICGLGRSKSASFRTFFELVRCGQPAVMVTGDDLLVFDGFRMFSVDAKRWDAHTRRRLLSLGNRLWRKLGADDLVFDLCEEALDREGRTTMGISYSCDGNTGSGDNDTIQKNCVSNFPIAVVAILTGGDMAGPLVDGVAPFAKSLHRVAAGVAISYEFIDEAGVEAGDEINYHNLEFCSAVPVRAVDGSWVAVGKIGRVVARFGLCTPGHKADVMLRSKALSLRAEAKHSSVLTYWADRAYEHAGAGRLAEMGEHDLGTRKYTEYMADEMGPTVCLQSEQVMLQVRYGASREDFIAAMKEVWDEFDRSGRVEFDNPLLISAVFRDN